MKGIIVCLLMVLACAYIIGCTQTSHVGDLSVGPDDRCPTCLKLKMTSEYSLQTEDQIRAACDSTCLYWLRGHDGYELVKRLDSLESVDSDGNLIIYYLVRTKTF